MPITNPSELLHYLRKLGVSPSKALSQNFLVDGNIVRKIASTADVEAGDWVLEIGPGPGALTEELLARGAHVVAVEADRTWAKALERLQTEDGRLTIFREDVMHFDIEHNFGSRLGQKTRGKVVSNLPYHLSSPILAKVVPRHNLFSVVVCLVQDEFARRCTGRPGTKNYGSFTVFLQLFSDPSYAHKVSRHCFYPQPKVESAILRCPLKPPPPLTSLAKFERFVRTAFEQRRKMLRKTWQEFAPAPQIEEALERIGQNPQARPEQLSLDDFLALYKTLSS